MPSLHTIIFVVPFCAFEAGFSSWVMTETWVSYCVSCVSCPCCSERPPRKPDLRWIQREECISAPTHFYVSIYSLSSNVWNSPKHWNRIWKMHWKQFWGIWCSLTVTASSMKDRYVLKGLCCFCQKFYFCVWKQLLTLNGTLSQHLQHLWGNWVMGIWMFIPQWKHRPECSQHP